MGCYSGGAGMKAGQEARFGIEIACYVSSRAQKLIAIRLPGQRESASAGGLHGGIAELAGGIRYEHRGFENSANARPVPETHLLYMPPSYWAAFLCSKLYFFETGVCLSAAAGADVFLLLNTPTGKSGIAQENW
jgi:hypothetical protein